jgi:hypothetical protein
LDDEREKGEIFASSEAKLILCVKILVFKFVSFGEKEMILIL